MAHKNFVTRLNDIWNEEIEKKDKTLLSLYKSHTELLMMILEVTKLPDSKAIRVTDPLKVEIYDDDGDYCHTIDCNPHYDLIQKIKKELKLED
jgi:hypothetical protein